jgi:hypothetical protein
MDFDGEKNESNMVRFLGIDPGGKEMTICPWNSIIETRGTGGSYPYRLWNNDDKIKMTEAIAFHRI